MNDTPEQVRAALVNSLTAQAEFREAKAAEYPEDERNARAAKVLRSVAEYAAELPNYDVRLKTMAPSAAGTDFLGGSAVRAALHRIGFHRALQGGYYPEGLDEPDAIIDAIADAAHDDELDAESLAWEEARTR